ncbi:MAG: MFS transporter [Anaerolineae bacterium]|jgi:fucose permease|nr:MFS transporter [Anaerolineae bacterium]
MKNSRMGLFLLFIAFIAFISLGLPDGLLGVAWPSMHTSLGAPLNALGVIVIGVTAGYVVSTVLSGKWVAALGIGKLLALSCTLTATALIGYTIVPVWWMAMLIGIMAGLGGGAIDAAINNYISHHHRALLFLLHAMFGIGTTTGPLIMNTAINTATWRSGYWAVGGFQLLLALTFLLTAKLWDVNGENSTGNDSDAPKPVAHARLRDTAKIPIVWFGVAFFLLYTGTEASIGQWSYTLFTESRGIDPNTAAFFIGAYWGAFTFGRVVSGLIVRVMSEHMFIRLSMIALVAGCTLMLLNVDSTLSLWCLPLVGFAVAPMFPSMVGSTQDRIAPEHVVNAIGFQIGAAGLGGGVIIAFGSVISGAFGLEIIFLTNLLAGIAIFVLYEVIHARGRVKH